MSLSDARMPRLIDKIEAKAEEIRTKAEQKDIEAEKVIKKVAKKK